MLTFLHISDLHRTEGPRLRNDELIAAIGSDAKRWNREGIPDPDLIVVSGDLIQGASVSASDPDSEVVAQYSEASDFLRRLATEFLDSDRYRVIIVPGNHDVHWKRAQRAMTKLVRCPERLASKILDSGSNLRWDWREQQAYEISNPSVYDSRFDHFRKFRTAFYSGLDPSPLSRSNGDLLFFEYPSLDLAVAGFSSWHGNDCFCHVGDIDPASVLSSRQLVSRSRARVALAVWHHNIVGGPRTHDYMDQRVIHKLIDFGFNIGLHGHQHYCGAAPFELRLPNLTSMVVVGAGSLAVGDSNLPSGERRQFNIVVIDPDHDSVTVHVRAMSSGGVFAGSHRDDFGGRTFIKLPLPCSRFRGGPSKDVQKLDAAFTALARKEYEKALGLVAAVDASHSGKKRQIEIDALENLGRLNELLELLDPPRNVDELTRAIALLLDAGRFDEAAARLEAGSTFVDRATVKQLSATITARRMIS